MATQGFNNLHLRPGEFIAIAGYAPVVSPLFSPHRFFQRGGQSHFRPHYRSLDLTHNQLIAYLGTNFPQPLPWRLWTPPPRLACSIASALRQKTSERDCLLAEPPPPMATGLNGPTSAQGCPSTPYLSLTKTLSQSSTPSTGTTEQGIFRPIDVQYDPEHLRMPYGRLDRQSRCWCPKTHG